MQITSYLAGLWGAECAGATLRLISPSVQERGDRREASHHTPLHHGHLTHLTPYTPYTLQYPTTYTPHTLHTSPLKHSTTYTPHTLNTLQTSHPNTLHTPTLYRPHTLHTLHTSHLIHLTPYRPHTSHLTEDTPVWSSLLVIARITMKTDKNIYYLVKTWSLHYNYLNSGNNLSGS